MSEAKNDGGPAFPVAYGGGRLEGMTLRDYFAAKAMQGLLAASGKFNTLDGSLLVKNSYAVADAMLKARGAA